MKREISLVTQHIYLWCPKYEHRQNIILCEVKKCKKIKKCEEYQSIKGEVIIGGHE